MFATALFIGGLWAGAAQPGVAAGLVWPAGDALRRWGDNGLVIDQGVASVDASAQYVLAALAVEGDDIVRFRYADAWKTEAAAPPACAFTFRRVERAMTQVEANAMADRLSGVELETLKTAHADFVLKGERAVEGAAAVPRYVHRFAWGEGDAAVTGISKTWMFVRDARTYYVNKQCTAQADAGVVVIDQLIGLNYRPDVLAPVVEPAETTSETPAEATPPAEPSPAAPAD